MVSLHVAEILLPEKHFHFPEKHLPKKHFPGPSFSELLIVRNQGAHDRIFLVRFNNEFFLRGANERNTR